MIRTVLLLLIAFPLLSGAYTIDGELRKWHKLAFQFDGPSVCENDNPNPFLDYKCEIIFTAPSGHQSAVPGFYAADGTAGETSANCGNKWQVNFAPNEEGSWSFVVSFRQGTDIAIDDNVIGLPVFFDGINDTFLVTSTNKSGSDLRGRGRLRYADEHYLQESETGKYFLKAGTNSPENFLAYHEFDQTFDNGGISTPGLVNGLHQYAPHVPDWNVGDPTWQGSKGKGIIGALNYLASEGMNVVYFITYNLDGGDGQDVWMWTDPAERYRFDVSKLEQWEVVLSHMDQLGIGMHIITQEIENDHELGGDESLNDVRKLYYRELIARFGHHLGLMWNLGEENSNSHAAITSYADYIRQLDPYDNPIGIHTADGQAESYYEAIFSDTSALANFEFTSIQGNGIFYNQWVQFLRNRSDIAGKKWVIYCDEQDPKVPLDSSSNDMEGIRESLWGELLGGGAGVEWYFGYQGSFGDVQSENWRQVDYLWNQTRYALNFFNSYLPFHQMVPANHLLAGSDNLCFAKDGEVYAGYFENGVNSNFSILTSGNGFFEIKWLDPIKGGELQFGTLSSSSGCSGAIAVGYPPYSPQQEWVVLVNALGGDSSVTLTSPTDGSQYPESTTILLSVDACTLPVSVSDVTYYDGEQVLAVATLFPFEADWENATPGIHRILAEVTFNDETTAMTDVAEIVVLPATNGAGKVILVDPPNGAEYDFGSTITLEAIVNEIVSESPATYLNVINPEQGWRKLKLGYHSTNIWHPKWDVSNSGNDAIEITLRDISGGTQWNKVLIRPQGNSSNPINLGPYVQSIGGVGNDWVKLTIPLSDFNSNIDFSQISFIEFPYSQGAQPFEIGISRIEFTGGNYPFLWFGGDKTDNGHDGDGGGGEMIAELVEGNVSSNAAIDFVNFFKGNDLIATDSVAPYVYEWNETGAGVFSLSAMAFYPDTILESQNPVAITVLPEPNPDPAIIITSPGDGAEYLLPTNVTLFTDVVNPNDLMQSATLFVDGVFFETDTSMPFLFDLTFITSGNIELIVHALNNTNGLVAADTVIIELIEPQPPHIHLIQPADSSVFLGSVNLIIEANATDSDGTIDYVEFFDAAGLIGSSSSIPFEWSLYNLEVGEYFFYGIAYDNHGLSDTSETIFVIVNEPPNTPPSVVITSPINNAIIIFNSLVGVTALGSDNDGQVEQVKFYKNGTFLSSDQNAPFDLSFLASDTGDIMLQAVAYDDDGDSSLSLPVNVVVVNDTTPPPVSIEIIDPQENDTFFEGEPVTILAQVEGSGSVQDTCIFLSVTNPEFGWRNLKIGHHHSNIWGNFYDVISSGNNTLEITVKDISGNTEWDELEVRPQGKGTNAPIFGDYVAEPIGDEWVTVAIPLSDFHSSLNFSNISYVQFPHCDGTGPFTMGIKKIEFTGGVNPFLWFGDDKTDNAHTGGNGGGQMLVELVTEIVGGASGVEIDHVEFYLSNTFLGEDFSSPYQFNIGNLAKGQFGLTALVVTEDAGSYFSPTVNISVIEPPNQIPEVNIISPTNGSNFEPPVDITFEVSATDGDGTIAEVSLFISNNLFGTLNIPPFEFIWSAGDIGTYEVYAISEDNDGESSISETLTVFVSMVPPEPTLIAITNPIEGSVFTENEDIIITATINENELDIDSPSYLNVVNESKSWKKLKLGYNATNLWGPSQDVTVGGNNVMEITLRDFGGDAEWNDIEVRPGGDGDLELDDYVDSELANTDWVTISIPFSDFDNDVDFDNFSNIQIPYSNGANAFDIGIQRIEFTGGSSPFLWFGGSHINNVHDGNGGGGQLLATLVEGTGASLDRIEFYDGTNYLGQELLPPYIQEWESPDIGDHELNAVAVFSDNSLVWANPINITVLQQSDKWSMSDDVETALLEYSVVPNPVKNLLKFTIGQEHVGNVNLCDIAGNQLILPMEITTDKGFTSVEINMSGLSSGLYFIKALTADGVLTMKVVKQ